MYCVKCDVAIIGGGPAGLAAAIAAKEEGAEKVLILERDSALGGILQQCIHPGFGLTRFHEELTGPEYYGRFVARAEELGVEAMLNSMVLQVNHEKQEILCTSSQYGLTSVQAGSIVLAMGCREKTRANIMVPGTRPAGLYTAGAAQRYVNMEGWMPGRRVVILGSGDIGLIMARRMTLEGAKVKVVAELMPYSGGLQRNIVQCLEDFGIPLKLSHTVVDIDGKERVKGVTLAQVDENRKPIPGTEEYISCDTLLLSVGLIPENELSTKLGVQMSSITNGPSVNESLETSVPGVFACGNVLHVHDLVDYVSQEAANAGKYAADYIQDLHVGSRSADETKAAIPILAKDGVRYTVPQTIRLSHMEDSLTIRFRVADVYRNCQIGIYLNNRPIRIIRRPRLAPGEMEQVILKKEELLGMEEQTGTPLSSISIAVQAGSD